MTTPRSRNLIAFNGRSALPPARRPFFFGVIGYWADGDEMHFRARGNPCRVWIYRAVQEDENASPIQGRVAELAETRRVLSTYQRGWMTAFPFASCTSASFAVSLRFVLVSRATSSSDLGGAFRMARPAATASS